MTTRRAVLGAIAVAWLLLGLYGVASYGHNYYVYRGYDPPHDPAGIVHGRLVSVKFRSGALHSLRSFLTYLPPGYDGQAAAGFRWPRRGFAVGGAPALFYP